jgi:hypothetical protein
MKIYLDLCVYNRPFDNQRYPRVALEAQGFIYLVEEVIRGNMTLVSSFALEEENMRSPLSERREKIEDLLSLAQDFVHYSRQIEGRAKGLERWGIMGMDAIHIACAESARADFFVTCDDQLIRKGEMRGGKLEVRIISLMEFVSKEVLKT